MFPAKGNRGRRTTTRSMKKGHPGGAVSPSRASPAPDLGIVDDEPAVRGHVVGIVGGHELEELKVSVRGLARHVEADAPDVVAPLT
jgi:hypothetical protein